MEELQVIQTKSGRQFKPWATKDDLTNPASVTAIASEIASGKQQIAKAINAKGGKASETESFTELAQDIQDTPTSGVLSNGIVQSEPFSFMEYICKVDTYPITKIDDSNITTISKSYAFYRQTKLLEVNFPNLTTISGGSTFASCSSLQGANFPNLTTISGGSTFRDCSALREVNFPNLTTISGGSTFAYCSALQGANFTNLTTISGSETFRDCSALREVNFPNLTTISGGYTFTSCSSLQEVNFPNLTTISGRDTFTSCSSLQEVNFTNLTTISGSSTFAYCSALQEVIFGTLIKCAEPFYVKKANLRNITIGQDTDINLPFQDWTATNVIAKGQSGIDELNTNLYNNLLTKLYDHSGDGETRTLRIGWLNNVTAENIAYANAKGWTLTT